MPLRRPTEVGPLTFLKASLSVVLWAHGSTLLPNSTTVLLRSHVGEPTALNGKPI